MKLKKDLLIRIIEQIPEGLDLKIGLKLLGELLELEEIVKDLIAKAMMESDLFGEEK